MNELLSDHIFFKRGTAIIVAAVLLGGLGYGIVTGIGESIRAYRHDEAWNQRGYIRCVDGRWTSGNIDLEGVNTDSSYVIYLGDKCLSQGSTPVINSHQ